MGSVVRKVIHCYLLVDTLSHLLLFFPLLLFAVIYRDVFGEQRHAAAQLHDDSEFDRARQLLQRAREAKRIEISSRQQQIWRLFRRGPQPLLEQVRLLFFSTFLKL